MHSPFAVSDFTDDEPRAQSPEREELLPSPPGDNNHEANAKFWSHLAGAALRDLHEMRKDRDAWCSRYEEMHSRMSQLRVRATELREAQTDLARGMAATLLMLEVLDDQRVAGDRLDMVGGDE